MAGFNASLRLSTASSTAGDSSKHERVRSLPIGGTLQQGSAFPSEFERRQDVQTLDNLGCGHVDRTYFCLSCQTVYLQGNNLYRGDHQLDFSCFGVQTQARGKMSTKPVAQISGD